MLRHFCSILCNKKSWIRGPQHKSVTMTIKECATHGVYWVNLKFKDHNSIDASLYTYLCIAICIVICISADGCILWQAYIRFYSSLQLPDWPKQRQISQKRALILTLFVAKGQLISKRLLVSSDSSKNERTNKFVFCLTVLETNLFLCFLEEPEDTKKSFWSFLTFMTPHLPENPCS